MQAASVPSPTPTPTPAAGGTTTGTVGPLLPTLLLQRNPNEVPDTNGPGNEEVYCLTNIANSGSSTLCAVGYYCQWLPSLTTGNARTLPHAYALMRQSLDSNNTFLRLKLASTANTPLRFLDLYSQASAGGSQAPTITQLAAYVWDLRFRIDTDLNETTFPDGNAANAPTSHPQSAGLFYQDQGHNNVS